MNSEHPTPETDAATESHHNERGELEIFVRVEFARKLERERDAARCAIRELEKCNATLTANAQDLKTRLQRLLFGTAERNPQRRILELRLDVADDVLEQSETATIIAESMRQLVDSLIARK